MDSRPTSVSIHDLIAGYSAKTVLRDLFIEFPAGQLTSILGPSGCGKTTLLKVIAGLIAPSNGSILFDGDPVAHVPSEKRQAAMVFQKPLLFPHLNVWDNVAFGLNIRHLEKQEIKLRTGLMLDMLQIAEFANKSPHQLSGGQEQRVALARALVTKPKVLLLDEPFSALDESLRGEMRLLVRRLQKELAMTTLFVTHDQEEAAQLSDQIVLLLGGTVAHQGTLEVLFTRPKTSNAAKFLGWKVLEGRATERGFESLLGVISISKEARPTHLAFRQECLKIKTGSEGFAATILEILHWPRGIRLQVRLESGLELIVEQPGSSTHFQVGQELRIQIPVEEMRWFAENWC